MKSHLLGLVFLAWIQHLGQAIEIPIGGGCRHNIKIEGLYDIVFASQDAGKYKPNTECIITIEAPRNHGVRLTFTHMDLQPVSAEGVCADYVQVQELQGKGLQSKTLTDKMCGVKIPEQIVTPYSRVEILFHSDDFVEKSGFKFSFTRSDSPTNHDNELSNALQVHSSGFVSWLLLFALVVIVI